MESQHEGDFLWMVDPMDHPLAAEATWYFDGSMMQNKWAQFRTTGFAVVVVHDGTLIGYGMGSPPHWCPTAAAAEAWALATIVQLSPTLPKMKTDCMSLLRTAEGGSVNATQGKRPLARIWRVIAHALDGRLQKLTDGHMLSWVPAHQSIAMIGEKQLPDGTRLSAIDWRANRLADALAKLAAGRRLLPKGASDLLKSGEAAVRYAAGILGMATRGANECKVSQVDQDGKEVTRTMRDATEAPRVYGKRKLPVVEAPPPAKVARTVRVEAWTEPKRPSAVRVANKRQREAGEQRLRDRVEEIGQALCVPPDRKSASERTAALRARVLGPSV
jgi:hypothetical protein